MQAPFVYINNIYAIINFFHLGAFVAQVVKFPAIPHVIGLVFEPVYEVGKKEIGEQGNGNAHDGPDKKTLADSFKPFHECFSYNRITNQEGDAPPYIPPRKIHIVIRASIPTPLLLRGPWPFARTKSQTQFRSHNNAGT
jgi:hypothetical protein